MSGFKKATHSQPAAALKGNSKAPRPTDFSNSRSQRYLGPADAENLAPNIDAGRGPGISRPMGPAAGAECKSQPGHRTSRSELPPPPKVEPSCSFVEYDSAAKTRRGPTAICSTLKLSPKLLPPTVDTDISITITTHEDAPEREEVAEEEKGEVLREVTVQNGPSRDHDAKSGDRYMVFAENVHGW